MKIRYFSQKVIMLLGMSLMIGSCSKDSNIPITIFTADDDIALGLQFDQEISKDPAEYPILDSTQYKDAYAHLYEVRNTILASGKLKYSNKFQWKCRIIRNDSVVNAFFS